MEYENLSEKDKERVLELVELITQDITPIVEQVIRKRLKLIVTEMVSQFREHKPNDENDSSKSEN